MSYVKKPSRIEGWPIHEGVESQIVVEGVNMTAMISTWAPQSAFAAHVHPHEQIGVCLQGKAVFTIDGKEYPVETGDVYHIPPNAPHAERNDGDEPAVFMECFAPVRQDLLRRRFEAKLVD